MLWKTCGMQPLEERYDVEGLISNILFVFADHPLVKQKLAELEREVTEGRVTSFRAANRLLELYTKYET